MRPWTSGTTVLMANNVRMSSERVKGLRGPLPRMGCMANAVVRKGATGAVTRDRGRPPKLPEHVRRAVVLEAAVARFAEVGRAGATIDEIAAASGVRKPAIYEMFGSKDDLFRAAVDKEVGALSDFFRVVNAETADLPRPERTRRRVDAALARAEAHPAGVPAAEPGAALVARGRSRRGTRAARRAGGSDRRQLPP